MKEESTYKENFQKESLYKEKNRRPEAKIRRLDAAEDRQYMLNEKYEVYEKQGAPMGATTLHYHNFYELVYVVDGEYSSMIENRIYHLKKGDFLLTDCNVMHKYHYVPGTNEYSKRIILWITEEMLKSLSDGEADLSACFKRTNADSCAYHFPIYYEEQLRGYLVKLAMSEMMDMELPGAKAVLDRGYLSLLFVYLNALCARRENLFAVKDMPEDPMVAVVSEYIETHISEPILVETLAEQVHMSKYHFLRKFKEVTGTTVHTFVNTKRLIRASEGLREGKSITQVYQEAGFCDYSSFLRNFKNTFGVAPGKYKDFY